MAIELLAALRAAFTDDTRLYRLEGDGELGELLVEAWSLKEELSAPWALHLSTLCERPDLNLDAMLGARLTLFTRLSDGSEYPRSGLVTEAHALDSDAGFCRYHVVVKPWFALYKLGRHSDVWQERSLTEIVESLFSQCPRYAAWSWAPCTAPFLDASRNGGVRSYTVQHRETDFDFVMRLLADEGIGYRFERDDTAPLGHKMVLFADSPNESSCPEDPTSRSSLGGRGIRFHGASAIEEQDTIQAFGGHRSLPVATVTRLSWDYKAKRSVATTVPTVSKFGGENAPRIESYDNAGAYAFANLAEAERAATLMQEAIEARHKRWFGRGTVRSFTAGTTFRLTQSLLDAVELGNAERDRTFLLTSVIHAGINNLPKELSDAIARHSGERAVDLLQPWVDADVREQAARSGYANAFEAIRSYIPWRPVLHDDKGVALYRKPTAPGMMAATVVGPDGETTPSGADEIHTDALGRVRIRFDFQSLSNTANASQTSTWVRVVQRHQGMQFIPRIGQSVLVNFVGGDIDRPLVIGATYSGRGEGGVAATPGGRAGRSDTSVFKHATDERPSGQGNLTGGNSPAWHGASADHAGHSNAAAFSGIKTKEFGGEGFNQLVFDDSNQQLRVQLATTQHGTQLNMGHLIHQADNHRGSFRGLGYELRTDAYGAVRGAQGVLISSYGTGPGEPAGDNAAGIVLALQAFKIAQVFSDAAKTHQTVQLSAHIGSMKPGQSFIDDKAAPLKALHTTLKGMVAAVNFESAIADAASRCTQTADGRLPHTTDPVVAIAARAGLGIVAGQDVQFAAGETITLASGRDTQWAIGGTARIHAGQAIGMLGGAIKPGSYAAGTGFTMIAGKGDIDMQAQANKMQIAAKNNVTLQSANAHVAWAAAKKISLSTAGGANITIEGGNITVQCPGKILVKAGRKSFVGPERVSYALPQMPKTICIECLLKAMKSGCPLASLS